MSDPELPELAHAAFLADRREGQGYDDFCRAANRVLSTVEGQTMLHHLKLVVGFDNSNFLAADNYNPYAAAGRDGAAAVVRELVWAAKVGEKKKL